MTKELINETTHTHQSTGQSKLTAYDLLEACKGLSDEQLDKVLTKARQIKGRRACGVDSR